MQKNHIDSVSTHAILVIMNLQLSERQLRLLNAVINEYIDSCEPVGSVTINKKYSIKASPATIRNEMASLLEMGFLDMLHTSSGRVPTPRAYKLFLEEMMEEEEIPVIQEVAIKQRLWPQRFQFEKLMYQAAVSLADVTKEMAILISNDRHVAYAGAVNLLDAQEFWDIETAKVALHLTDRFEMLDQIFKRNAFSGSDVMVAIGEDIGINKLVNAAFVFAPFVSGNRSGYVSVFGPARMRYQSVIPAVRYTKNVMEDLGSSW